MTGRSMSAPSTAACAHSLQAAKKIKFMTAGSIYSSPAVSSDGTIYVGSRDNNLYAVH